jgi:hypothetical protein
MTATAAMHFCEFPSIFNALYSFKEFKDMARGSVL